MKAEAATLTGAIPLPLTVESTPSRFAAFLELTKPRLTMLVLLTVAAGYVAGARRASNPAVVLWTVLGAGLVAAGASAWNQVLERKRDARMRRTASRPIPAGIVTPVEGAIFGTVMAILGCVLLAATSRPIAAVVAATTFLLYVLIYTPLKPRTTLNTAIGAIPGALPPVIGWSAATGRLGIEATALFLILFLWQFPHFLAIAWIYRVDYRRGGHKMLPSVDPDGSITSRQAFWYALALVPVGLLPTVVGLAGPFYFAGTLVVGLFYLVAATRFMTTTNDGSARRLLWSSFLYLPAVLALLLANPTPDARVAALPAIDRVVAADSP